jgi:hypothetical protein
MLIDIVNIKPIAGMLLFLEHLVQYQEIVFKRSVGNLLGLLRYHIFESDLEIKLLIIADINRENHRLLKLLR